MESCSNRKNVQIYLRFEILQSCHPFPWWQLCTLMAFSQPASWGIHLEYISINKCALLKVNFIPPNFIVGTMQVPGGRCVNLYRIAEPLSNSQWNCWAPNTNQQKSHKSNFSNIQVLGNILKTQFSLIQPQCLISKML